MEVTLRKRTSKHTSIHIIAQHKQQCILVVAHLLPALTDEDKVRCNQLHRIDSCSICTWHCKDERAVVASRAHSIGKMKEWSFSRTQHWHLLFNVEKHPYVTTIIEPMNLTDGMHMGNLCTTGFVTCREDRELSNAICKDNMRRHSSASQMYMLLDKQGRPLTLDLFILPQELAASRSTAASQ
jgi:hypothetical protein